jgi:hypothetical protein
MAFNVRLILITRGEFAFVDFAFGEISFAFMAQGINQSIP